MRAHNEQFIGGLCHLCNAVPLWGLLFCGWVWFQLREESRTVRRQAQQAMMFHVLMMAALLIWMLVELLTRLLGVLSLQKVAVLVSFLNDKIIEATLLVYVGICVYGCWRLLSGRTFHYPLVRLRP